MNIVKRETLILKYATLLISLTLILYCIEKFGNDFYSTSQDLENHISLANYIFTARDVAISPYMATYPPVSHYIAAILSPVFGNLLSSFTKISLIATIFIYFIIFTLSNKNSILHSAITFILFFIALHYGIGIIGSEVIGNYFYPQLISSAVGILIIYLMVYEYKFKYSFDFYLIFLFGVAVGFTIHSTVTFIVVGAYLVKLTSIAFMSKYNSKKLIFNSILISFITILLSLAIPYNRLMSELSLHNGWLQFGVLADNNTINRIGYIFLLFSFLISVFFIIKYSLSFDKNNFLCNYQITIVSVLFSGSFISMVHLLLVLIDKSTFYAVKKNFFFNVTFLCILFSLLLSNLILKMIPLRINRRLSIFKNKYSSLFALIISIGILHLLYRSQPVASICALDAIGKDCIKLQEMEGFKARQMVIAQLPINNVFNYMITSCYLNFPNRQVLWDILSGKIEGDLLSSCAQGANSDSDLPFQYVITSTTNILPTEPASGKLINSDSLKILNKEDYISKFLTPPAISCGETIKTNSKRNNMIFKFGVSKGEDWGIWSDGTHTKIQVTVNTSKNDNTLVLLIKPFIEGNRNTFKASAQINGRNIDLGSFSSANSGLQSIEIPFNKSDLDTSNSLIVDFYYTNTMPCFEASGLQTGDPRQLSFGFVNMSIK